MTTIEQLRKMSINEMVTLIEEATGERVPAEMQLRLRGLHSQGKIPDQYLEGVANAINRRPKK